jgi:hypothetical protein
MPTCKYDWSTAERSFIQAPDRDRVTLKDISSRHNIPYQTIRRYAAKHRWISRRDTIHYEARKLQQPITKYPYSTRGMPKNMAHMLQRLTIPNILS